MRYWSLVVVALASSSGCYFGPASPGDDETGSEATGNDGSGSPTGASDPTAGSDPTAASDPTVTSGPMESSGAPETSDSTAGPMDGPMEAGDSTTGEMSGCESGPLPGPIPGCSPAPMPSSGDIHQDCVDRINQFRWECQCLPPLARWNEAETCSNDQSSADQNGGGPHGNFGQCGENAQNTCPDWGSEQDIIVGCLQAMWDEGPGEPFEAHGHYINMSSMDYSRVACGFSSGGGGVWSNQNFSP
jgi:hypothetical protein